MAQSPSVFFGKHYVYRKVIRKKGESFERLVNRYKRIHGMKIVPLVRNKRYRRKFLTKRLVRIRAIYSAKLKAKA
ncbi:MAG: hypothetical protein UR28_C0002G0032 [Candidatus Peregrinibacteria bacterium GW2011_GWF2_33_10]|nr:MAG: hypothetical protein UR28_C0002G0032 [Candidatus Peregrinibacteria bacterium GW2011_GWF2_33_10]OGJ45612.1 MAG: hypothetical protein A2263_00730 [Candidatus Peregrinibacteria bacterium RIFOXYA2_FULL_33_21]OGJ46775.1 MAG: hypothetical protein A2272_02545 [Candidatus Peregrinibacteria bacterium RIFOXYA12_FULL_33_12]OGJ51203.1 MAG: hypothetical protein A2307_01110 [Candidatus Peregrinibacteria bacterium RIFOXYB2_FULL_33_20]